MRFMRAPTNPTWLKKETPHLVEIQNTSTGMPRHESVSRKQPRAVRFHPLALVSAPSKHTPLGNSIAAVQMLTLIEINCAVGLHKRTVLTVGTVQTDCKSNNV
jgi:hypothetical protein